jgi:protein ImuA
MFMDLAIPDKPVAAPPARPRAAASAAIDALRERIALIGRGHAKGAAAQGLGFGVAAIDQALPGGGLAQNALHEAASAGADTEHAAAATLFVAGVLARLGGPVLWVLRQADLFAPGLAAAGLHPGRVLFAEAGKDVLPVMEEGLRHAGLAAVVGELTGRLTLVASRRLQLAAEQSGVMAVLIRRSPVFDDPALKEPSAAATRWRVAALPSPERALWRLDLTRCRGAEPNSWIVEACDATGRLGLAADPADRSHRAA